MKLQTTVLVALCALMLTSTSASGLTALNSYYQFLDTVVMKLYKPIIWYVIFYWSNSMACNLLTSKAIDAMGVTTTYTDEEQLDLCTTGVKMYWEQFFYGGAVSNQPYDLSWSWTPS